MKTKLNESFDELKDILLGIDASNKGALEMLKNLQKRALQTDLAIWLIENKQELGEKIQLKKPEYDYTDFDNCREIDKNETDIETNVLTINGSDVYIHYEMYFEAKCWGEIISYDEEEPTWNSEVTQCDYFVTSIYIDEQEYPMSEDVQTQLDAILND